MPGHQLTQEDRKALSRLLCTASPAHFAVHASGGYWVPYRHLLIILAALMRVVTGACKRLQISIPPQHGKSEFVSWYFLAWLICMRPDLRLMLASYEAEQAEQWGRKVRDTVEEFGGLFGVEVDPRSSAAHRWNIRGRRGRMVTAGIGGALTGKAADVAVIDDPIKDAVQASSLAYLEKCKEWFIKVLERRLSKKGAIILVMTRWEEDDLAGWLYALEKEGKGEPWERVILPALAPYPSELTEDAKEYYGVDPLGRQPGEALCPELHPAEEFKNWRDKDETSFWGLGQQYPFTPAGGMFLRDWFAARWTYENNPLRYDGQKKCWVYKEGVSHFDHVASTWDFQFGSQTGPSWTVGQVWGKMGGRFWLLHQFREKCEFPEMIKAFKEVCRLFPMIGPKLIEAKAAGPYVGKLMKSELLGSIPGIILLDAQGDKPKRASGVSYIYQALDVLLPPEIVTWVRGHIKEFLAFPKGTDDQVDAAAQYLAWATSRLEVRTHDAKPEGF